MSHAGRKVVSKKPGALHRDFSLGFQKIKGGLKSALNYL